MKVTLIGDVHCKIDKYKKIVKSIEHDTIQIGDFGFDIEHLEKSKLNNKDKILFGNHDDYRFLNANYSLGNYGTYHNMFYVRGAKSKDSSLLCEGFNYFREEELSYEKCGDVIELYSLVKPDIVVSHDCPYSIAIKLFGIDDKTITRNLLETMMNIHKPKKWIFGHHHRSKNEVINGINFICLAELETLEIEI